MHVLSVSSLKGGVGKTTVALGLASAAINKGLNTLLIDLDPQCDATSGLAVTSEFGTSVAEVLENPKDQIIRRAIVNSNWSRQSRMDVMIGSPRSLMLDHPAPAISDVWKLENVLTMLEDEYDLVIIDTPPSINALTRTAWVASDRVLIVTEPSLYSVIAADRAKKAIEEISAKLTPRLQLLGIVINRFRPQSTEHEFRLTELNEMFGNQIMHPYFEEKAALQQATGAARPIHSWPADGSAEIARGFDWVLSSALSDMERVAPSREKAVGIDMTSRGTDHPLHEIVQEQNPKKKKRRLFRRR